MTDADISQKTTNKMTILYSDNRSFTCRKGFRKLAMVLNIKTVQEQSKMLEKTQS